jgi:hypothetical protein
MANFAQADLRFLLPLHSGQQVVVLGNAPQLIEALLAENIHVERDIYQAKYHELSVNALPFEPASIDHVIIPLPPDARLLWWLDEAARILKPGGWLLLGVHNAMRLQRLRFWKRDRSRGVSLMWFNCQKLFARKGFQIANGYGVHDDLQRPQHLVPLERPAITPYFFEHVIAPASRVGRLAQYVAALLTNLRLHSVLYTDIIIVASREN